MKKLLLTGSLVSALAFLPYVASAQTLTQADIQTVIPQFQDALTSLNAYTSYVQNRMAVDNLLFGAYANYLGGWSTRLGQGTQLSGAEITTLNDSLENMNRQLSISAAWRAEVDTGIAGITQILSNINSIIASAV